MGYNESDTRAKLITPALYHRGWTEEHIRREENAGQTVIINGKPRKLQKRVDYTLRLKIGEDTQPVAIALIEAKAEDLPPTHGLEQVKVYNQCERFNVPFVYSTNGHLFVEFDAVTGLTSRPRPMAEFPTQEEIRQRYETYKGFNLEDKAAKPLLTRYAGGAEAGRRYYQDAAIRAALEKIAAGGNRVLLTLATGAGKTFLATQLLKRISDAGQLRRALFLCDRDELRTQAVAAFQNVFGNDAAVVSSRNPQQNARVLIATYQTLDVDTDDADSSFLRDNYPENFFSHIVIDECHRSAWGKWSEVLKRNPNAVQIGLTATPRQLVGANEDSKEARQDKQITADNLQHFGEPVYEYDIGQGIEDGYLAACEIHKGRVNIDDTGLTIEEILALNPVNADTGKQITEEELKEIYQHPDYEASILLPDRVYAMAHDLFQQILEHNNGDPHQKTIIFCVRDRHCDDVAIALNNIYQHWCKENEVQPKRYYAFKATAASHGTQYLADLRGSSQSHFIATTVELLTTGVDVPRLDNITFFRYMNSPISFYQMIGRGTRIFAPNNKLMFRVYDYTDATRLFGQGFITKIQGERTIAPDGERPERDKPPTISVEGLDVIVTDAGQYILVTIDGQPVPITLEEYRERLAAKLLQEAATLADFRTQWIEPVNRRALLESLPESGRSVLLIQHLQAMDDYDLFDVLAELGYGLDAKTRVERAEAFDYKHEVWLTALPLVTAATIRAIAAQFAHNGIDSLESPQLFQTPSVRNAGGLNALKTLDAAKMLRETKERIYAA
jgi:type I restriction enzyme R subunit